MVAPDVAVSDVAAPLRIGVLGMSEGNGHPFSFSAIINGYHPEGWPDAGWDVIWRYLSEREVSEFGFPGVRVTHAWTQLPELTAKLCTACCIPHAVDHPTDLIGEVDAVLLARDDYETHAELALPLLEAGLFVFVDKPLALEVGELARFAPYLEAGRVMSCSGFRYARELDALRLGNEPLGSLRLLRGAVLNSWEKYGVHILEAVCAATHLLPVRVVPLPSPHASLLLTLSDGTPFQLDALGSVAKTFRIDVWGEQGSRSYELTDNFTAFRRTLYQFVAMARGTRPAIAPEETLTLMKTIIAGRRALATGRALEVADVV